MAEQLGDGVTALKEGSAVVTLGDGGRGGVCCVHPGDVVGINLVDVEHHRCRHREVALDEGQRRHRAGLGPRSLEQVLQGYGDMILAPVPADGGDVVGRREVDETTEGAHDEAVEVALPSI